MLFKNLIFLLLVKSIHLQSTKSNDSDYFENFLHELGEKINLEDPRVDEFFDNFSRKFQKFYFEPGEKLIRKQIFVKNIKTVLKLNKEQKSYKASVNKFSDMNFEEFKKYFLMKPSLNLHFATKEKNVSHVHHHKARILQKTDVSKMKQKISWKKYAGKVKTQERCAACYAFSSVAAFETMMRISRDTDEEFSEQHVIDCIKKNKGCTSGSPSRVLNYIYDNGIARSKDYPYEGKLNPCRSDLLKSVDLAHENLEYKKLDKGVLEVLKALKKGPVILIQTVNKNFKHYSGGVFNDQTCTDPLNHSTLAIGYDLTAPIPYIEIKNSWDSDWGEKGFFKMALGAISNGNGGVCQFANHDYNISPYFDD